MIRLAVLALLLPLAACGSSEEPEVVLEGTDPVQADGDLAPDADLAPEAEQAPASDMTPGTDLEPESTLQPDSAANPIPSTDE